MTFTKTLSIALLATALAFTGCKKKDDAAVKTDDKAAAAAAPAAQAPAAKPAESAPAAVAGMPASDDEYITKATAMMNKMLGVFKADGTDCDKLATDVTAVATDPAIESLNAYEKAHPDVKKKFEDGSKDQMSAMETAMTPAMTACKDSQKFKDALAKLD